MSKSIMAPAAAAARLAKAGVRILSLLTTLVGLGILVFMSVKWDLPQGAAITATCFAAVADALAIAGLLDAAHQSKRAEKALVYFGDFLALAVGVPGVILLSLNGDVFKNLYRSPRPWQTAPSPAGLGPSRGSGPSSSSSTSSSSSSSRYKLRSRQSYSYSPSPSGVPLSGIPSNPGYTTLPSSIPYYTTTTTPSPNPASNHSSTTPPPTGTGTGPHRFPGQPYRFSWRMRWRHLNELNDLSQWILVAVIAWRAVFLVWACFNCVRGMRRRKGPAARDAEAGRGKVVDAMVPVEPRAQGPGGSGGAAAG